jgi:hypothetical protein
VQGTQWGEFEAVIVDGGLEGAQLAEFGQLGMKVVVTE